jgi:hypothetical protein
MGFFSNLGRSLGGMIGITGLLPESETQKLQAELSKAQSTLNQSFQTGMYAWAKDQILLDNQIILLIQANAKLSLIRDNYNQQISDHDSFLINTRLVITMTMVLVLFSYLIFLPKCC